MKPQPKFIGVHFVEPFPVIHQGANLTRNNATGPFFAGNSVLSWHIETPKVRVWLERSAAYWRERGWTTSIVEHKR